jgi:hypothetical protein
MEVGRSQGQAGRASFPQLALLGLYFVCINDLKRQNTSMLRICQTMATTKRNQNQKNQGKNKRKVQIPQVGSNSKLVTLELGLPP